MKRVNRLMLLIVSLCLAAISQLIHLSMVMNQVLPPEYQIWDHPDINVGLSNETISACLLNYDDNHFLIEWLAFHYQTLPLRRLIIATDPRSRTSPSEILQRWQPLMNITEWSDDDYFPLSYRRSILKSRKYPNTTKLVLMHRTRQRFFYLNCMRQLRREHEADVNSSLPVRSSRRNWAVFIDVDEFLFPNRNWKFQFLLPSRQTGGVTIAQLLYRLQNSRNFQGPCIGLPRLLFGTKRDDDDNDPHRLALDTSVNASLVTVRDAISSITPKLLTWTWKWHETLQNNDRNKAGKAIIDLSRVPSNVIGLGQVDVHRPSMNCCTIEHVWTSNTDSPIVLHHYVGTLEQFTFRSDPREGKRTFSNYLEYQNVNFSTIHPTDSHQWLVDFVKTVGVEKAKVLLEGVGQVDKSAPPVLSLEESFQKLGHVIFPGGLDSATTPLRQNMSA
jgi:hypothetical protein